MDLCSLHPVTIELASDFVAGRSADGSAVATRLRDESLRGLEEGRNRGPDEVAFAFGAFLAERDRSFAGPSLSFTFWEARVDRGIGMLLRPPSRLLIDAGMDVTLARRLPIRLDNAGGRMGGCYIPPHLVPQLKELLDARLQRHARRLAEAEIDPVGFLGLMHEAVDFALGRGAGLYEARDVLGTPGLIGEIVLMDPKRVAKPFRKQIEEAAKPERRPGLVARLRGRSSQNGNADAVDGAGPHGGTP